MMRGSELERHSENIMVCKKCGTVYKYFDVVMRMDSSELPGDLVWMTSCKECGVIDYREIWPDSIDN